MNRLRSFQLKTAFLLPILLGGIGFGGCSGIELTPASKSVSQRLENHTMTGMAIPESRTAAPEAPKASLQLVKTAELMITVDSVADGIATVMAIARQQQGEVLGLQDETPEGYGNRPRAYLQLRVPQAKLDVTIDALAELGMVQRRSIQAEDISNQLVDFQARLRNLQRTEETLLGIMERSGSVGDVLKVAQELSNVRNSIEQIDAQLKDLQNRVTYANISLALEAAIAASSPQRSVNVQLQETWKGATSSVGRFTVNGLQLGIWLLVYSPYWLIPGGAIAFWYKGIRQRSSVPASNPESSR